MSINYLQFKFYFNVYCLYDFAISQIYSVICHCSAAYHRVLCVGDRQFREVTRTWANGGQVSPRPRERGEKKQNGRSGLDVFFFLGKNEMAYKLVNELDLGLGPKSKLLASCNLWPALGATVTKPQRRRRQKRKPAWPRRNLQRAVGLLGRPPSLRPCPGFLCLAAPQSTKPTATATTSRAVEA